MVLLALLSDLAGWDEGVRGGVSGFRLMGFRVLGFLGFSVKGLGFGV